MISTCFFDLDLTLIDSQEILYQGLEKVLDPNTRQFIMVVLTGRGYPRYNEAVAKNPVLAKRASYIALEHGARIITNTNETIHYVMLSITELNRICEYIVRHEVSSVSFYPQDMLKPTYVWSNSPLSSLGLSAAYTKGVTHVENKEDLFKAFYKDRPCTITVRAPVGSKPVRPNGIAYYTRGQNINFVPYGVNKGMAAKIIAKKENIPLHNALAAGNDFNDLPLLTLPSLSGRIFVGTDLSLHDKKVLPTDTVYVPDPTKLGTVLKQMI